jgi:pyruvate dehydrogenase E2 component (dihydrolipoamide acetyltransferase)
MEIIVKYEVVMPKLGLVMEKGIVVKWLKKVGDRVEKGEPLFEVETEKVTLEITATDSGILMTIVTPANVEVPVGTLLAIIADEGDEIPQDIEHAPPVQSMPVPVAAESRKDVLERIQLSPLSKERRVTAERMIKSHLGTAPVTVIMEVNAESARELAESYKNDDTSASPSITDIIIKATAMALCEHPIMNSRFDDDHITILQDINIGLAIAIESGLVVPVLRNADKLALRDIAAATKMLEQKAREKSLALDDISGGTFTISNMGMYGADIFAPIINPPEAGILGVGAIKMRPVVVDNQFITKPMMWLALTFDHRILDGVPATLFLKRVKENLENPAQLQ